MKMSDFVPSVVSFFSFFRQRMAIPGDRGDLTGSDS